MSTKNPLLFLEFAELGEFLDPRPCVLRVWRLRESSWVEFRGPAYCVWDYENPSPAQKVHDALEGWHACVLHAGDVLTLLPEHPDYSRVLDLLNLTETNLP